MFESLRKYKIKYEDAQVEIDFVRDIIRIRNTEIESQKVIIRQCGNYVKGLEDKLQKMKNTLDFTTDQLVECKFDLNMKDRK